MKSKNDIEQQIQRIRRLYPGHRMYNKALMLNLLYNDRMSMTDTNQKLHKKYVSCHYYGSGIVREGLEAEAERLLRLMGETKYPREVYACHSR